MAADEGAADDGAGALADGAGAGALPTAFTAFWHSGERVAMWLRRHCKAAWPPVGTPAQFDAKSERQNWRIAPACAWVGCCALAAPDSTPSANAMAVPAMCHRNLCDRCIAPAHWV